MSKRAALDLKLKKDDWTDGPSLNLGKKSKLNTILSSRERKE